jgi:hypothetical protein
MNNVDTIIKKYFIISKDVINFLEKLKQVETFEFEFEIDKFLKRNKLLTIAEKNCLLELRKIK